MAFTNNKRRAIKTRFSALDKVITEFRPGELIIIAGGPQSGKTTFVMNIVYNIAKDLSMPIGNISIDQSAEKCVFGLLKISSKHHAEKITLTDFSFSDLDSIVLAEEDVKNLPIFIDDEQIEEISQIEEKIIALKNEQNVSFLIIDSVPFLQDQNISKEQKIVLSLKKLAVALNIPIMLILQLPPVEEPSDMSKLPTWTSLEKNMDVVMFIQRKQKEELTDSMKHICSIHIVKPVTSGVRKIEIEINHQLAISSS